MKPTDFGAINCSIARTYDVVGERWSLLILREAFFGTRRFEDFQRHLGVARNILTERLNSLVDGGILRRVPYSDHPPRDEYRLTDKGRDLHHVLLALKTWGDRWTDSKGARPLEARHETCGKRFDVAAVCSHCREDVDVRNVLLELGRGATAADREGWQERQQRVRARRSE